MAKDELVSLDDLKEKWKIDTKNSSREISSIFSTEYKAYTENPSDYKGDNFQVQKLQKICKQIDFQLIPYSSLTDIIFSMDEKIDKYSELETDFHVVIQSKINRYIINRFKEVKPSPKDTQLKEVKPSTKDMELEVFEDTGDIINISKISDEEKQGIIVMHKITEHIKLAISQKRGLYEKQKKEIENLANSINSIEEQANEVEQKSEVLEKKQDNIISQYISILGIFAAILMTAFGGIQSFTAIYKDNKFNLIDSLLIACIGFMGLLLVVFLLLNSIAKLSNKSIDSGNKKDKWYLRHPSFVNSSIILSTIALILIAYKVSMNPPSFSWWGSVYIVSFLYLLIMARIFNKFRYRDLLNWKN